MRCFFMLAAAACVILGGCVKEEGHSSGGHRGVIQVDCEQLRKAAAAYSPPPSGYLHAASVAGMEALRADEVCVEVENHLSRNELEVSVKLMIDNTDFDLKPLTIPPGETMPVSFRVPVSILDGHVFSAVIEPRRPEKLPAWERDLDFGQREAVFNAEEYWRVRRVGFAPEAEGCPSRWEEKPGILIETGTGSGISAKIHTGWDGEYFFLAADVKDEKHFNTKRGGSIWDGDALQFAVAPPDIAEPFNLGLALTGEGVRLHQWMGPEVAPEKLEYAVIRDEEKKKTFYELSVPLELLFPRAQAGLMSGLNVVFFDDDDGEGYDYWIQIAPGLAGGWDPSAFDRFVLLD